MNTHQEMSHAIKKLAEHPFKTSENRKIIDDHIRTLLLGDSADVTIAALLKDELGYLGSDEAFKAAYYLNQSLCTAQGAKAAGLPPKRRGKSYRLQNIKPGEPIIRVLVAQQLGGAMVQDVDTAVAGILGDNFDERTKKKLIAELMPRVMSDVYWSKRVQEYRV